MERLRAAVIYFARVPCPKATSPGTSAPLADAFLLKCKLVGSEQLLKIALLTPI